MTTTAAATTGSLYYFFPDGKDALVQGVVAVDGAAYEPSSST